MCVQAQCACIHICIQSGRDTHRTERKRKRKSKQREIRFPKCCPRKRRESVNIWTLAIFLLALTSFSFPHISCMHSCKYNASYHITDIGSEDGEKVNTACTRIQLYKRLMLLEVKKMHFPRRMTTFVGDSVFPLQKKSNCCLRAREKLGRLGERAVVGINCTEETRRERERRTKRRSINNPPSQTHKAASDSPPPSQVRDLPNKKGSFSCFTPAVGVIGKSTSIP